MIPAPLGQETDERAQAEIRRILRQAELAYRLFVCGCVLVGVTVLVAILWLWKM